MGSDTPVLDPVSEPDTEAHTDQDRPWNVVVWNDPVTLMSYVVYVLRKLFGHDEAKATRLMLQVHHEGKAVVNSGPRERAEHDVSRLHAHGLQATVQKG
ncbi:MAG: ATP-dependent Clp protease adapter ClpS [Actinobacteria bacterium QS_5_72_10]|jgi:ATP-dependent Clp protease adaptor protein ClpS|nr:MAG: ATP-dependent Clp protease adapter ClpS [Actinobacteria bacterium QS_5_72_10]